MHHLKNFKSFIDVGLDLFKPVTLLIGKNGSGKTNVIEGVELLAQLVNGTPLYEISDLGKGSRTYEVRGGLQDCVRKGETNFSLGFSGLVTFAQGKKPFQYEISVNANNEPYICSESLSVGDRNIFIAQSSAKTDILNIQYDNFARGGNKPSVSVSADRSILSRYSSLVSFPEKANKVYCQAAIRTVSMIQKYLNRAFVFDPNSKLMRDYDRTGQPVLRRDGTNISSVLYSLSKGDKDSQASLTTILERIVQLPDESFVSFDFIDTRQGDVLFGLRRADGVTIDARMLSDGTLRALAILLALETSPQFSRVIVEEIDNGIHPSRVKMLLDAVWEASNRRSLNVLATTHNPATLNSLSEAQLASVVLCAYDDTSGSSKLVRLSDVPRSEAIFSGGRLGDMVTKEVLERHLLPKFEEEQREKALSWLDSLS